MGTMINRVIEFSIRNRTLVIGAGLVLACWGVFALFQTPVDAIPDLSENQVVVFTEWMGHSPPEIENQITYPLSVDLQGLAGVRVVRSSSDFNFSMINLIFEDSVGFATARQRVAERLSGAANLVPAGVVPELAPDALATGQIFWYTIEGAGYDLGRLRAIQDWYVRGQLSSVQGVAEVASVGGRPIEYQIDVDPNRLREHGVTLAAVTRAVSQSNAAVGGHVIEQTNAEYIVRGIGWLGANRETDEGATGASDPRQIIRDIEQTVLPSPREPATETTHSPLTAHHSLPLHVSDVATVSLGSGPRRGVLEKDGNEVTGGVVLMRAGENPLEITRRIEQKLEKLRAGLPPGVRIVPFYDRRPLIEGAIRTVTTTLVEAIVTATICVVIVLMHLRTSFIIAITLPLATLASFATMWTLRRLGVADIQTNIMSLAGIAISIGVLVDSSIVMAENVMFHLRGRFGDRPVQGDIRELVLPACRQVGRPIFFSVLIMLVSFIPVFALGGMEGKMFRPLAFTKSFALIAVAVLAITLVPALCTVLIKGRLRAERDSWLVRSVIDVYRPVLDYLLDRPAPLVWFLSVTLVVGLAPLGVHWLFLAAVFVGVVACGLATAVRGRALSNDRSHANRRRAGEQTRSWLWAAASVASLVVIALIANQTMQPLGREFMTPLDEGMIMDMPLTVPCASITQSGDDLKARDMVLCRFPEVEMVVGKAGRAETSTDPAPLDMIETMVSFRPAELWPKRALRRADAERQTRAVLDALVARGVARAPDDAAERTVLVDETAAAALDSFDSLMREVAYLKNRQFDEELGRQLVQFAVERTVAAIANTGRLARRPAPSDLALLLPNDLADVAGRLAASPAMDDVSSLVRHTADALARLEFAEQDGDLLRAEDGVLARVAGIARELAGSTTATLAERVRDAVEHRRLALWREHIRELNADLHERAATAFTRIVADELLRRTTVVHAGVAAAIEKRKKPPLVTSAASSVVPRPGHHGQSAGATPLPDPLPVVDELRDELARAFAARLLLWPKDRREFTAFGGELDRAVQMPGWANVWTKPIQNRVDMLATGVNTPVGVRVLGRNLDEVVRVSEEIAAVVKRVPGAADVIADPIRGKGYLEIRPDRERAALAGVRVADINEVIETAVGGRIVTTTVEGRERHPVRVRYARNWRQDDEAVKNLLVPVAHDSRDASALDTRAAAAPHVPLDTVADVRITEGPATIKSENGLLRNYVRLSVRDRGLVEFVNEARAVVAEKVKLPEGVYVEWAGQFEHEVRAARTLWLIAPAVVGVILLILFLTYHDFADALLMMLAVPGALAGGVFFQWLFGYKLSVTVGVGYIACFGMATATGIIMLVYLRDAVARAGGLKNISLEELRQAVMNGAVHRLRPKLLTEGTTIIGLAPMLWATGTGAEVIRPMAAPVLGGILIADEVIDLLLPVLFYWVRSRRWSRLHAYERDEASAEVAGRAIGDSHVPGDAPSCLVDLDDQLVGTGHTADP